MDFGRLLKLQPILSKLDPETLELIARFMQTALSTPDPNEYVKSTLRKAIGEVDGRHASEPIEVEIETK